MPVKTRAFAALIIGASALGGCGKNVDEPTPPAPAVSAAPIPAAERPALGLFTTLPLIWGENADITAMLDAPAAPDPARLGLEARYRLEPLDELTEEGLAPLRRLALIQPRVLAGGENVALDNWVRAGGRAVLFADPLLTRHSQFALGDRRRPQDTAVLSPILARWGLALDEVDAGDLPASVAVLGQSVPLREAGRLRLIPHEAEGTCQLVAEGVAAQCRIADGQVLVVADAALFDGDEGAPEDGATAAALIAAALAD